MRMNYDGIPDGYTHAKPACYEPEKQIKEVLEWLKTDL